jgi:ribonuclease-3
VLGLAVADLLLRRFPKESEGGLAARFAALVSEPTLAEIALELELDRHLMLAPGEQAAGAVRPAVLADALEATLGAVFLDGGFEVAARLVRRLIERRARDMAAPPRDPKSTLQEWAQARGIVRPAYSVVAIEGPDHAPSFEVSVLLAGYPPVAASAPSKRAAEQAAAARLLGLLEEADGDVG